jgi:NAD-dependent dihydropyrimidine dehydrogenase PreA subunit
LREKNEERVKDYSELRGHVGVLKQLGKVRVVDFGKEKKERKEIKPFVTMTIDPEKSDGCGDYTFTCPMEVLEVRKNGRKAISIPTDQESCCGLSYVRCAILAMGYVGGKEAANRAKAVDMPDVPEDQIDAIRNEALSPLKPTDGVRPGRDEEKNPSAYLKIHDV